MSETKSTTIDMEAVRRAAYAVEIGASCDRADLAQLCALAREMAPRERHMEIVDGAPSVGEPHAAQAAEVSLVDDARQLRAQVWDLTKVLLDLGVRWEGGSGHAAARLLRSMRADLDRIRSQNADLVVGIGDVVDRSVSISQATDYLRDLVMMGRDKALAMSARRSALLKAAITNLDEDGRHGGDDLTQRLSDRVDRIERLLDEYGFIDVPKGP